MATYNVSKLAYGSDTFTIKDNSGALSKHTHSSDYLYRSGAYRGVTDVTFQPFINGSRANRLAFLPAKNVIIEQTVDGGTTWTDAGVSDSYKTGLFSETRPAIYIPQINGVRSPLCGIRVTITAMNYNVPSGTSETQKYNYWNSTYVASTERYNQVKDFYFWISSSDTSIGLKIEGAKGDGAWQNVFSDESYYMTGWSGADFISLSNARVFGGGTNQTGNSYWNYRLTFMSKGKNGTDDFDTGSKTQKHSVSEIRAYGPSYWTKGNEYAATDKLYTHDIYKNAYFPSSIYPSINESGNIGSSSLKWSNGYFANVNTTNINGSAYVKTDNNYTTAEKNKLSGIATGAQVNVLEGIQKNGTAVAITNKVANITVPTKTSDLTNDSGFLTSYTETDPTVPAWAKASAKPTYTASEVGAATSSHAHGNITNGGDITANATIASGDRIVINDESASKVTNSSITFGTSTTSYLANNGTWQSPPTYSAMSQSEATTGTSTTGRLITAKVLKDTYIPWGGTDQLERLTPDQSWTISGATYSQGMAGDGTYLYLTNRANSSATTAMKISRLNMSTMAVVDTHTVGQGHYNSLYYYEGKLYGTGVTSSSNYSKVSVIDTSTWSETIKDSPSCWGVGVKKIANKGYITALWVSSQRAITYYDSYILDTSNKQTPLARVTLDFTGSTTVQGSFHMTDRYIWTLETTYSDETRESGHQVIRCFTYGGMLVKAWYVDSITEELEDIWVSDDNLTAYVNTINGKIYKFTFPALYRTLTSSISEVGALKSGTLKHVYSYPAPNAVSSRQTYTRGSSSYYFTRAFAISDFAFLGEIGEFIPPTLWLNNRPFKGAFYNNYAEIWFHGSYNWAGGGRLSFAFKFERTSDTYNYYYWLTRVQITGRDDNTSSPRIEYNVSTTAGSWSSDMESCLSTMYTDGWFFGNFYIEGLSYIVGVPNSSTDLAII